ncbi:MAG: cytochrome c maturation protein CcmE [Pseudomonadota bacterium]
MKTLYKKSNRATKFKTRRRIYIFLLSFTCFALSIALVLFALQENIRFFYSPSDLATLQSPPAETIRIGGIVKKGSVVKNEHSGQISFAVSDYKHSIQVQYSGFLPNLFREGQGVVVLGRLIDQTQFEADEVLAKHDENYMPPEVVDALKRAGTWRE